MKEQTADYARMYGEMVRAVEKAMDILIEAQRKCEEMYIEAGGQEQEGPEE